MTNHSNAVGIGSTRLHSDSQATPTERRSRNCAEHRPAEPRVSQSFPSLRGGQSSLRVDPNLRCAYRRSMNRRMCRKLSQFDDRVERSLSGVQDPMVAESHSLLQVERREQKSDVLDIVLDCFIKRSIVAGLKPRYRRRFLPIVRWLWPVLMRCSSLSRPAWNNNRFGMTSPFFFYIPCECSRSSILSMSPHICRLSFTSSLFRSAEDRWRCVPRLTDRRSTFFILHSLCTSSQPQFNSLLLFNHARSSSLDASPKRRATARLRRFRELSSNPWNRSSDLELIDSLIMCLLSLLNRSVDSSTGRNATLCFGISWIRRESLPEHRHTSTTNTRTFPMKIPTARRKSEQWNKSTSDQNGFHWDRAPIVDEGPHQPREASRGWKHRSLSTRDQFNGHDEQTEPSERLCMCSVCNCADNWLSLSSSCWSPLSFLSDRWLHRWLSLYLFLLSWMTDCFALTTI